MSITNLEEITMDFRFSFLACFLVAFLVDSVLCQEVFDVTEYGAVADGKSDNKKAFMDTWQAACKCQGLFTIVVPAGTYLLGPVVFGGPCSSSNWQIEGTLKATPDVGAYNKYGWIEFNRIHELTVGGGGTLDGQGAEAWQLKHNCPKNMNCRNLPTSLRLNGVNNATISDLTIVDSKGFHVNFHQSANIQAHRLNIIAPAASPNTDGIHISAANNINITNTNIGTGDDCISIGPGATNVNIYKVTCGPGHGISVGSLGKYKNEKDVSGVTVKNCTLSDTKNGLRLKTWPGAPPSKALDFVFEDVTLNNVANPIIINQKYCPHRHCDDVPSGVKIAGVTFRRVKGTSITPVAVNMVCSKTKPCEDVKFEDIDLTYTGSKAATTSTCDNVEASFLGDQNPSPCY